MSTRKQPKSKSLPPTRREQVSLNEKLALGVSILALAVSAWSLVESRQATRSSDIAALHAKIADSLVKHRELHSQITCTFTATKTTAAREKLAEFKESIENLAGLLVQMRYVEDSRLQEMESSTDRRNVEYYKMLDALTEYKALLPPEELSRVNSLCGPGAR